MYVTIPKRIATLAQALKDVYGLDKLWILLSILIYIPFLRPFLGFFDQETARAIKRGRAPYALVSILKKTILISVDGCFFRFRPWTTDMDIVWLKDEADVARLIEVKEGDIVVDIGAHIGAYAIRLAKKVGSSGLVIAIEPDHRNFGLLVENVKLNNLGNVMVINKAAYSERCVVDLFLHDMYMSRSSLYKEFRDDYSEKIQVIADTVDNILAELKVEHVDLLKIDVEGAELDVLRGAPATLEKVERVIVEVWPEKLNEVHKLMERAGLKISREIPHLTNNKLRYYMLFAERT